MRLCLYLTALLCCAAPAAAQTQPATPQCARFEYLTDIADGTVADHVEPAMATPGAFGGEVVCTLYRRDDGAVELALVEHVPEAGRGLVHVIYRSDQIAAWLYPEGGGERMRNGACFDDFPVAGEFECETYLGEDGLLLERTISDTIQLVGLNFVVAPGVLFEGTTFALELSRADPSEIRVRLVFPASDGLTLDLVNPSGDGTAFGFTTTGPLVAANNALDVNGAILRVEVSATRGNFWESFEVSADDLAFQMQYLGNLSTLMALGVAASRGVRF